VKQIARHTAQQIFPQSRMSVAAHDHEIGPQTLHFIYQTYPCLAPGFNAMQSRVNPMMLQMCDGIASEQRRLRRFFIADHHDGDFLGLVQVWHSLAQGARGFPAAVPGDNHSAKRRRRLLPIGN
jgi:hypothetical protein